MGLVELILAIIGGLFILGYGIYIVGALVFAWIFNRAINGPSRRSRWY